MISYNEITVQDKREIENYWVEYWKDKGRVNYDLNYLKLDRMETCFVFRNNNNLCLISGIDDISEFIPNTYRILTRATTTHYRPKVWGKYIEDKFLSNVVASISLDWCRKQDSNKKVVVTTNADSRITNVTKRSKKKWLIERTTENIYGVNQVVWDIDYEKCYDNRIRNYIRH
jgi:hypothetical protein